MQKTGQHPSQDLLDDLCSRFIVNLPAEELTSYERMLFMVEQAHWFYEDECREQQPHLRSFSLREFTVLLFQRCPALQQRYTPAQVHAIYDSFNKYKVSVPVVGAVLLDESLQRCLLVKGWKANAAWGFPRGKKSKNEEDEECAVREVEEETGFDISPLLNRDDFLEETVGGRRCRLFVVAVPTGFTRGEGVRPQFEPKTKKEISEIAWHSITDLLVMQTEGGAAAPQAVSKGATGAKFYLVQPFVRQITAWIARHTTPATRQAAAANPVARHTIITCWKAPKGSTTTSSCSSISTTTTTTSTTTISSHYTSIDGSSPNATTSSPPHPPLISAASPLSSQPLPGTNTPGKVATDPLPEHWAGRLHGFGSGEPVAQVGITLAAALASYNSPSVLVAQSKLVVTVDHRQTDKPFFQSLRNFQFDYGPIMAALEFR